MATYKDACGTERHHCEPDHTVCFPHRLCGAAIQCCIEDECGALWIDNNEYASQVNFCPYCGYKSPTQIDWSGESKNHTDEWRQFRIELGL